MKNKILSLILLSFTFVSSCSDGQVSVNWNNYSPIVKERIKKMVSEKNCSGLQTEFDSADKNNEAQRRRTGEGNTDLMEYLDSKMREIGCYA